MLIHRSNVDKYFYLVKKTYFQPSFFPISYAKNPRLLGIEAARRDRKAGPPERIGKDRVEALSNKYYDKYRRS